MSVTFAKELEDLLVVQVKGTLTFEDLKQFENEARAAIDRSRKVRALADFTEFSGWGKAGDWGDLTFMIEYDPCIEKIAVIATVKWKDQISMFLGAGRRQAKVKFFPEGQTQDARDWLLNERE